MFCPKCGKEKGDSPGNLCPDCAAAINGVSASYHAPEKKNITHIIIGVAVIAIVIIAAASLRSGGRDDALVGRWQRIEDTHGTGVIVTRHFSADGTYSGAVSINGITQSQWNGTWRTTEERIYLSVTHNSGVERGWESHGYFYLSQNTLTLSTSPAGGGLTEIYTRMR